MAAGRYDAELRSSVSAVASLFADKDSIDSLMENPYRLGKPKHAAPVKVSEERQNAVFDAVDEYFANGGR